MSERKLNDLFQRLAYESAKKQSELILQEEDELNKAPIPAESRRRFESMLEQKYKPKSQIKRYHHLSWSPKRIAIAVAACIAVLLLIPASSEAVRGRITQLIRTVFPSFTELKISDYHEIVVGNQIYKLTYIPKGYQLKEDQSINGFTSLTYRDSENNALFIDVSPANTVAGVDTENAIVKPITIWGEDGFTVQKGSFYSVVWSTEDHLFEVYGSNISLDELILVAKGLRAK